MAIQNGRSNTAGHAPSSLVDGQVFINQADARLFTRVTGGGVRMTPLGAFTGDGGAGGKPGYVPAPAAGDAAANRYLSATGAWTAPANFTGDTGMGGVAGFVPAPSRGDAAAGKFLAANGGWLVPSVPARQAVTGIAAAYTLATSDLGAFLLLTGGPYVIGSTLPPALGNGWWTSLRNGDQNIKTITPGGGVLIDGHPSITVYPNEAFDILTDGTNLYTSGRSRDVLIGQQTVTSTVGAVTFTGTLGDPEITEYDLLVTNATLSQVSSIALRVGSAGNISSDNLYLQERTARNGYFYAQDTCFTLEGGTQTTGHNVRVGIQGVRSGAVFMQSVANASGALTLTSGAYAAANANIDSLQILSAPTYGGAITGGTFVVHGRRI